MRVLLKGGCSFLIAASLLVVGTNSRADELLVMPYSCFAAGGEPVLTPSEDKGYRILGGREQRNFTACSPSDPSKCRRWTVHRFDIDCNGARVPWASVVAAADENRNVWIEGDRLLIRMPWTWALSRDDPCARFTEFDRRVPRFRRLERRCAMRKARAPDSFVTMPKGFAPKFSIDAIFVAGAPTQAPGNTAANPAAASRVAANESRLEVPPLPPRIAASERKAAIESRDTVAAVSAETKASPASPSTETEVKAAPAAAGSPSSPTIINRPDSDGANASQETPGTTTKPPQAPTVAAADTAAKSDDANTLAMVQPVPSWNPQITRAAQNQGPSDIGGLGSYLRDPLTIAVSTLALLSSLLIAGFVLLRRRDASRAYVATSRDIGSVWLDESLGRQEPSSALVTAKETASPAPAQRPSSSSSRTMPERIPDRTVSWGDTIPQDRSEALRVLGIGVSSDTNHAAIKKIVDGLRMSWHPDHANGEDDRRIRELRLKQINAAWEIISETRVEEHA